MSDAEILERVRELVAPQWRSSLPEGDLPETPGEAYVLGRNDMIDALRAVLGE